MDFINACRNGDLEQAKRLRKLCVCPNDVKAFDQACYYGHLSVAKWLSKYLIYMDGRDSIEFQCAFNTACGSGYIKIAKWLHTTFNIDIHDNNDYPFVYACESGHLNIIKWLYNNFNISTEVLNSGFVFVCGSYFDIVLWLNKKGINSKKCIYDGFIESCICGKLEIAKYLYDLEYRIDVDYCFIFNKVCKQGHINIAKWLHELGYNYNTKVYNKSFRLACRKGHLDIAKWLYTFNVDVSAKNELVLKDACKKGHYKVAKWLYKMGADIRVCNDILFEIACNNNRINIAKWLHEFDNTMHKKFCLQDFCKVGRNKLIRWLYELDENLTFDKNEYFINACKHNKLHMAKWIHTLGVNTDNDKLFRHACKHGNLEMAQWIYTLNVDINSKNNYAFICACKHNKIKVAKWLYDISVNVKNIIDEAFNYVTNSIRYDDNIKMIKWLYDIDYMVLVRNLKYMDIKKLKLLGFSGITAKILAESVSCHYKQIALENIVYDVNDIDDIAIEALFYYDCVDYLQKLNLPYVSYDVIDDKIVNGVIHKNSTKNARNI